MEVVFKIIGLLPPNIALSIFSQELKTNLGVAFSSSPSFIIDPEKIKISPFKK